MRRMIRPLMLCSSLAILSSVLAQTPATAPPAPADTKPEAPEPVRGLVSRTADALPGLTLLAPLNSTDIHLVDLDGQIVHTWHTTQVPGAATYLPMAL